MRNTITLDAWQTGQNSFTQFNTFHITFEYYENTSAVLEYLEAVVENLESTPRGDGVVSGSFTETHYDRDGDDFAVEYAFVLTPIEEEVYA